MIHCPNCEDEPCPDNYIFFHFFPDMTASVPDGEVTQGVQPATQPSSYPVRPIPLYPQYYGQSMVYRQPPYPVMPGYPIQMMQPMMMPGFQQQIMNPVFQQYAAAPGQHGQMSCASAPATVPCPDCGCPMVPPAPSIQQCVQPAGPSVPQQSDADTPGNQLHGGTASIDSLQDNTAQISPPQSNTAPTAALQGNPAPTAPLHGYPAPNAPLQGYPAPHAPVQSNLAPTAPLQGYPAPPVHVQNTAADAPFPAAAVRFPSNSAHFPFAAALAFAKSMASGDAPDMNIFPILDFKQTTALAFAYELDANLDSNPEETHLLAKNIGVMPQAIMRWFHNRRLTTQLMN